MKNHFSNKVRAVILINSILFSACKKEYHPTNITLYNQPLSVIQSNIQGSWKLQYEKGGVCSICITDFKNSDYIWEFAANDKIRQTYNGTLQTDATIDWIKDPAAYPTGQPNTIMSFSDKRGYPSKLIVDGIFNDTLKLHDAYTADPVNYNFTKMK